VLKKTTLWLGRLFPTSKQANNTFRTYSPIKHIATTKQNTIRRTISKLGKIRKG